MQKIIIFLVISILSGCMTTESIRNVYDNPGQPGYITKNISDFDGKYQISLEPAFVGDLEKSKLFALGLIWHSKLEKGKYILIAQYSGAVKFMPEQPLAFNIDGDFISLSPIDINQTGVTDKKTALTNVTFSRTVDRGYFTEKQYWISDENLKKIVNAEKVIVRVELLNQDWEQRLEPTTEGNLHVQNLYPYLWAKDSFKNFLENIPQK